MFLRLWTRAPRTRMVSCSERISVVAGVISFVAKGKPRQRVSSAQPKLQIIRPPSKQGKRPNCAGVGESARADSWLLGKRGLAEGRGVVEFAWKGSRSRHMKG